MEVKKVNVKYIILRQLKILYEDKKGYLFLIILIRIFSAGLLPYILAYIPKIFVDLLMEKSGINIYYKQIIVIFLGVMIITIVSMICESVLDVQLSAIRRMEVEKMQRWFQKIEYENLEDPQFTVKNESGVEALGGEKGFFGVYLNLIELTIYSFASIICALRLTDINLYIVSICVLAVVLKGIFGGKMGKYIKENEPIRSKLYRQKEYFVKLGFDFTYGKDIRIFELSDRLMKKFIEKSRRYIENLKQVSRKELRLEFWTQSIVLCRNIVGTLLIIGIFYQGKINIADVVLYLGLFNALTQALDNLTNQWIELVKNASVVSNYFELIDDIQYKEKDTKVKLDNSIKSISFENVFFQYPGTDRQILKDINLQINSGERIAFIGINGAGKSTLINVLTRLFQCSDGQIKINGIDLRELDREEYYKRFSIVCQHVHIYAGTILENVSGEIGERIDRDRAIQCLKAMKLDGKIEKLPHKYDTQILKIIDEEGTVFSGGENQKIAIARALYKNADVFILDEPTSALDVLAEKEIYELFHRATTDKIAIFISHRLSTTRFCDRIYMLSPEGIIEEGNHEQLMRRKGEYYRMFQTQARYYKEGK